MQPLSSPIETNLGILVVGHGTSSIVGIAEFAWTIARLRQCFPKLPLAYGFLELASPSIEQGMEVLAKKGVKSICSSPLLLFSAGHAKSDIPDEVQRAAQRFGIQVASQSEVLGNHPHIVELSVHRFLEANDPKARNSAFVLVGRGSRDSEAQLAAADFLAKCQIMAGLPLARLAFLAMAKPDIYEVVEELGRLALAKVVLVPHLLFHGELVEKCIRIVQEAAVQFPGTEWRIAKRLGPNLAIVDAIADRIRQSMEGKCP